MGQKKPEQRYMEIFKSQIKKGDLAGAIISIKNAQNQARTKSEIDSLLKYYGELSIALYNKQEYNNALEISKAQLLLAKKHGDRLRTSLAYNNMAVQYRVMGRLRPAAQNLLLGLKIAEQLKDSLTQKKFYNNLASVFIDLNDKRNSLLYAKKSFELAMQLRDSTQLARSFSNLAISEVLNGEYEQAIQHLGLQNLFAQQLKNPSLQIESYLNLGEIYVKKKEPKRALALYQKAYEIGQKSGKKDNDIYINYGIAACYHELGNNITAAGYLKLSIEDAKTNMPKNDLKEVYHLASKIAEALKNPADALSYWKRYNELDDSILNATTQEYIQEMDIQYKTSVKERKLTQQQLQLSGKNLELQNKNRYIIITLSIIILMICGVTIAYLITKSKNQAIQLTLLKAQIHPHFLFNTLNNLYALSLNKSNDSPGVVLGLSQILRYILYECNSAHVSLGKEIEIIERYITLERIRYRNRLEINLDLQGDLAGYKIVPLLLLPLVENSFKHGISKIESDGWIKIETKIKAGELVFKISNNKPPEEVNRLKRSEFGNIGLLNIKKRLCILYPGTHDIRIINEDDVFMVILKVKLSS